MRPRYRPENVLLLFLAVGLPALAAAQDAPRPAVELSAGYASFVDESPIHHLTAGGGWRWQPTRRVSLGPEVVFMRGPGADRDWFLTAKLVLDSMPAPAASIYFVVDGGIMLHRDVFLAAPYWSKEGAGSVGGGVRINLTDRVYVAPEVRIGWEPHVRAAAIVGWRMQD